ncbi:IS110 family transposase [Escherichia coli]|uniref:IS110 family transposase n=1 Tax=Enterobacteriaceae TaxID=543 RepID=UPI0015E992F6|nr:IS110 family transposase [Klebsiella pneumoniae]EFH7886072.1 IS110 family transposase [Escherichia coli]EIV7933813.1 IS110 family transposase [Klebsiella pneumoniae]QMC33024.1 IS110 family transposase [Klebsiella pneumoniae]HBW8332672.1 IS110 family transposase [Klebsiella pneumoniae]
MYQLGIDVSKKTLDICLMLEGIRGRLKTKRIKNDFRAVHTINAWLQKHDCALCDVHIIMEATGVYHELLATGLHLAGGKVSLANPHRTREFARGMDILTKTDKVDAWMLACYGALKKPDAWTPPAEEIRHLSALLKRRDLLVTDATREKNRLEKYRATHTPHVVIVSAENMLRRLNDELSEIELMLKQHVERHVFLKEDYALLTSIKSVGPQLGLNMLVILRSHDFRTAEQVAAFLGVAPVEKRSGTSVRGRSRMSKIGPPEIRAKLYLAALCGLRFNKAMKSMYERLCLNGKAKMVAIGALMRKLIHWCFGVLKSRQPFDIDFINVGRMQASIAALG